MVCSTLAGKCPAEQGRASEFHRDRFFSTVTAVNSSVSCSWADRTAFNDILGDAEITAEPNGGLYS